jgi:hypothetical protein
MLHGSYLLIICQYSAQRAYLLCYLNSITEKFAVCQVSNFVKGVTHLLAQSTRKETSTMKAASWKPQASSGFTRTGMVTLVLYIIIAGFALVDNNLNLASF